MRAIHSCVTLRLDAGHERSQHVAEVADDADVDRDDLADLRRVDVDVDLLAPDARRCGRCR